MILHESAEMYLETIYMLAQERETVRAIDIAREMGYSRPTISEWMGKLAKAGYVAIREDGGVSLTEKGKETAAKIYERHVTLEMLLRTLGVSPEVAREDACRVEHYISEETFEALKAHYERYSD